jgi:membrane associated rhomboid family serine protease
MQTVGKKVPVVTAVACLAAVVIFIGITAEKSDSWESVAKWGYLPTERILSGAYWGLITSAFVHIELWHIAMNVFWLWVLGSAMEQSVGPVKFLAFMLAAAFVSSGVELATGDVGIGLSGVGYAIFGFGWISRDRLPELKRVVPDRVVSMFLIWLVACFPLTMLGILRVANAAHVSGLLFGMAIAAVFVLRYRLLLTAPGLALLLACAVVPLFWAPWSREWVSAQAGIAHTQHDYPRAVALYRRSLQMGGDRTWAWHNLAVIYGYTHDASNYADALERLRQLDPGSAREVETDYGPPQKAVEDESNP